MSTVTLERTAIDAARRQLYLGGEWRGGRNGGTLPVEDPSTGGDPLRGGRRRRPATPRPPSTRRLRRSVPGGGPRRDSVRTSSAAPSRRCPPGRMSSSSSSPWVLLKAGARHVPLRGEAKPLQRAVVISPVAEDGARRGRPASQLGRGDCSLLLEESGRVPGGLERPGLVREDLTRGARAFARVSPPSG